MISRLESFDAEAKCIRGCIKNIRELHKHYYTNNGDSVGEAQANGAVMRVLKYLVGFLGYVTGEK